MTIEDIHKWIAFITDKPMGSYWSMAEIDDSLDRGQMKYFNELYSQYALAEKLQDALSPFKASYDFLTSDTTGGQIHLPDTYQYLLAGHIVVQDGTHTRYPSLQIIAEDALAKRLDSQMRPVTASKPIATILGKASGITTIQLYPKQAMAGTVFYLRRPLAPKYAYTQDGRAITYDPTTSVQLEWGESEISEIVIRAIEFLGVSMDDKSITQYADAKSKQIN